MTNDKVDFLKDNKSIHSTNLLQTLWILLLCQRTVMLGPIYQQLHVLVYMQTNRTMCYKHLSKLKKYVLICICLWFNIVYSGYIVDNKIIMWKTMII